MARPTLGLTGRPLLWCTDGLACADGRYREYWEAPTLLRLHEHCTANPDDFVAYGHTKTNDQARTQYTDFLLAESTNRRCMDAMNNGSAACGVNPYTPTHGPCAQNTLGRQMTPWSDRGGCGATYCHFSGNFWWARCDYVRTLNPPWSEVELSAAERIGPPFFGWWGDIRPHGRYFWEWWCVPPASNPDLPPHPKHPRA